MNNRLGVLFAALSVFAMLVVPVSLGHTQEIANSDQVLEEGTPPGEVGLRLNYPEAFTGYTLIAPYLSTTTYLVDMLGEVVHQWEGEETPAAGAYLLEDGSLLRCADTENPRFRSSGTGGRVQRSM